ncbi:hypothetical protein EDD17DRAFT_734397 [Pisolithus thermaeus]|nr:hypothetical protein EDD17DRAFT_734397 [Pisolithus thermaeus]
MASSKGSYRRCVLDPPLLLSTDTPFPSPGSSFLPPPIPVPHEFALLRKQSKDGDLRQDEPANVSASNAAGDVDPPNGVVSPIRVLTLVRSFLPRFIISLLNIPTSLLRMASFQDVPPDSTHTPPTPSSFASTPTPCQSIHDVHRLSTHSAASLTSSRPAPPSPAISRRASGHLSRSSSTARSRPPSGTTTSRPTSSVTSSTTTSLSRNPSGRRTKDISNTPMTAVTESVVEFDGNETIDTPIPRIIKDDPDTPLPHPSSQPRSPTTPTPYLICIRDYAFPSTDVRFSGNGPHVPRPNRPRILARKLRRRTHSSSSNASTTSSTTTTTTSSENGDGGNEDDNDNDSWGNQNGWRTFGWGWGISARMSMSGHNASSATSSDAPSRSDLDRNFEADSDSDAEYVDVEEDFPVDSADPSFSQANEDEDEDFGNELLPGLYRALYPFEPEGTAEVRLEEDQIVRVLGRGGGVGWAVVVKNGLKDTGLHALVPESYLEVLKLDCEGEGEVDLDVECEAAGGMDA